MTALDDITAGQRGIAGLVTRLSERFRPVSRRSVLVGAAVAGSALATKPREYALRPVAAYDTICGPGNTAASGWTVFCCTINKGVNACPPGSFAAGWWKAADSSWCGGGYRYIVDCNASCTRCTSGCSDHICDSRCWSCSCGTGSTATCDQRRVCCNAFRYGQCNTQVSCSGGVHCRVVSCVPPYRWANCTTTSLQDNRTSEHSAPCIPIWSAIVRKYDAMGAQASWLKASLGPQRAVGDGRGQYVRYQGGGIYWTEATGAHATTNTVIRGWETVGGCRGHLKYPIADPTKARVGDGWIQLFERGCVTGTSSIPPTAVYSPSWEVWNQNGREGGRLGYPTSPRVANSDGRGWHQRFQNGYITDSTKTTTNAVYFPASVIWERQGREHGPLGYPVAPREDHSYGPGVGWAQRFQGGFIVDSPRTVTTSVSYPASVVWEGEGFWDGELGFPTAERTVTGSGSWIQTFEGGAITDSAQTVTTAVFGYIYPGWVAADRERGVLGYPTQRQATDSRGVHQVFQGGELWALFSDDRRQARRVYGAVLEEWNQAGGATGRYGYPVTDTVPDGNRLTCRFENGTITA
jgi:uncharacterized protein with LGFP repeats